VAYWLPVLSRPGNQFSVQQATLRITGSGIKDPVLVDVSSGKLTAIRWMNGQEGSLEQMPLSDTVMAIADRSFFDWPELPEAPSDLNVHERSDGMQISWRLHGGNPEFVSVERRAASNRTWQPLSKLGANAVSFSDTHANQSRGSISYRVRAGNRAGVSAYSNIATVGR
jgi:hypothetical protein